MGKLRFSVDEAGGRAEGVGDFGGRGVLHMIHISLFVPSFIHNFNNNRETYE